MNPCKEGESLPLHPSYEQDRVARAFWRLSYRCGRTYMNGQDALGHPVLVKHEREKDDSYDRRLRMTKPRNHCGPIIRQYNDFVYRLPAQRPAKPPEYLAFLANVDGHGTSMDKFMRGGLKVAQIQRESYLLPDSTKPADVTMTKAQAQAAKVRHVIRRVEPDSVVWWLDVDGVLAEALVLFVDADGQPFAIFYDATGSQRIHLAKDEQAAGIKLKVSAVESVVAHSYGACPLVRHRPLFDDDDDSCTGGEAQIAPLAELQQDVANKLSLLDTEICDCTFSQWIATGVDAASVKDVVVGNNRIICMPDPQAKFSSIGADPAQAESIAKRIEESQTELYRLAGISTGDPLAGPSQVESGVAKAFKFNDLAANLSALADSCEEAENAIMQRLANAGAIEYPGDVKYPDNFDLPDLGAELETVIRVVTAGALPQIIKDKLIRRFTDRNLALDDAEQKELDQQLEEGATVGADPFNPSGRKAGT